MTSAISAPRTATRSRIPTRIASLTPLWIAIVVSIASRSYFGVQLMKPPDILGIPLGVVFAGVWVGWMLIGTGIVWQSRSRDIEALALFAFTIPATLLAVCGPAVILIMQNFSGA